MKRIAFVRDRIGEVMGGVVSAVTSFALFVPLQDSLVEGLLRFARGFGLRQGGRCGLKFSRSRSAFHERILP